MDKRNIKINFDEILYIESLKNYVRIITTKRIYTILQKLKQLEKILPAQDFCRIHRSYIISFKHTTSFDNDSIYLDNKKALPISRQYKNILEHRITLLSSDPKRQSRILRIDIDESQKN